MTENNNNKSISNSNHNRERLGVIGGGGGDHHNGLLRTATHPPETRSSSVVANTSVLQWGNRKRLRCMKIQVKDHNNRSDPASVATFQRTSVRVDRPIVRSDTNDNTNRKDRTPHPSSVTTATPNGKSFLNLRLRPSSPSHCIIRNSENSIGMKGPINGVIKGLSSPVSGGVQDKRDSAYNTTTIATRTNNKNNHASHNDGGSGSSEIAHDSKRAGSSSGSDAIPAVWPPKCMITLTNKEKEEDFIAFKGSKLPQRPKKRAKCIQRTVNLVCPGAWLCDLTLERYEVREKRISKKTPRGLKDMGNKDSDSE